MSELNKKEKKPFKIKVWVLLLIYLLIAIAVTSVLVIINKTKNNGDVIGIDTSIIETKKEDRKDVKRITLKDKYAANNLEIEIINEEIGEVVSEYDYDSDGIIDEIDKRVSIEYVQISGLKNKTIEDNVNKKIKDKVNELKYEYLQEEKYPGKVNIYVTTYSAGFANTLSISVSATAYEDVTDENKYYWQAECISYITDAFNFRLDTGEEFSFEDIFTDDADIYHIISQAIYENLASSFKYVEESEDGERIWDMNMDNLDYGQIEVDLVREVNRFKRNKDDLIFNVYYRYINVYYPTDNPDDYTSMLTIDMYDYVEYIALYTRFLTEESIFENGDLEPKTYVFRYVYEEDFAEEMSFEEISNNVLVRTSGYAGVGYEQQLEERKSKVKNYLIRNSEKDMIYLYEIYLNCEMNWEYANGNVRIMTRKFYEDNKDYIMRYLDYSDDSYEEPNFDIEKIQDRYFEIRFDENNNVIELKYDDIIEEEIEGGSDEIIEDSEQEIEDYTNTVVGDYSNTINENTSNTISNTIINDNIGNNVDNEEVINNTSVPDVSNTIDNTSVEDTNTNTAIDGVSTIDTSNVGI